MAIKQFSVYNLGIGNTLDFVSDEAIESTKVVSVNSTSVYNVPGIKSKIVHDWAGVLKTSYVQETVAQIITKFGS
jgi:hypothetical protein